MELESKPVHLAIVGLLLVDLCAVVADILQSLHGKAEDLHRCVRYLADCPGQCHGHFHERHHSEAAFYISIAVLSVLAANIAALLVAFGAGFFLHPGFVLDLVVVAVALGLEVSLSTDTAGLLAVLTLWRIVRVAHGIFEVTDETFEAELREVGDKVAAAEAMHCDDLNRLQAQQARITELENQIKQCSNG
eukprot:SM000003S11150  [mRNA]  locus=s3:1218461:1219498:- [translate_table: standard]